MKVSFTHFSSDAPIKPFYQQAVDYLVHEFDLKFEDAAYLLRELRNHRSSLWVNALTCSLNFYIESDKSLRVEIYGDNGLWADSEVEMPIDIEILKQAYEGGEFREFIPTTNKEWDAYSGVEKL